MHSNVKYQIFTMEKTSSQKFLREYYFAISKIKLPQEFHATRYLSIKLITGAQPKAGTGLKMQTVRFFNVTLLGIYR